jgi:hypothetical protein
VPDLACLDLVALRGCDLGRPHVKLGTIHA